MMNRILVPIDFSPSSENALRYAIALSKDWGMKLTLLHCYPFQEAIRPYHFDKKEYSVGVREMLTHLHEANSDEKDPDTRYLARPGSVIDKVALISGDYTLIVLSGNHYRSGFQRWIGSRASAIASEAQCPVLIVPPTAKYTSWENIWHIKRNEEEPGILKRQASELKIDVTTIQTKSLQQTTFTSVIWRNMVAYIQTPKVEMLEIIQKARSEETVHLMILVSHQRNTFEKFITDDVTHVIFQFDIPVLIFQADS